MKLLPPGLIAVVAVLAILIVFADVASAQEPAPQPAPTAPADSGGRRSFWPSGIGVGVSVGSQLAVDRDQPDDLGVGVLVRIMRRRSGFIPAFSFGSRGSVTVDAQGADGIVVGTARVRPVMGGVGWTRPLAPRLSLQTIGLVGYSFNGIGDSNADSPRLTLPGAVSDVENSLAWELSSRLWYDLHPKIGVMAGVGYFHTRPDLLLGDGSRRSWNADRVTLEVGIAYTVFQRKKPSPPAAAAAPGR
jgi:hypothetical protein